MNPIATLVTIAVLTAITLAIVLALRLEKPWLQPWAILRAVVQLGILSLILHGIIANPVWVGLFLLVMVGAATWVVFRRLDLAPGRIPTVVLTMVVASAIPTLAVFVTGAVEFSPRYLLAVGGIVIGNVMTVSTLMGRSTAALFVSDRDQIEGWLALGAPIRTATRREVRLAASTALIPSTDQTRTTGIVTLPGAFVGAVFAGASPLEAAQFQLIVLAAILAAGALAAASWTFALGAPKTLPLA
ncbi:ABC transporter permease [Glaciihabitans sp. dw_435]|uniref:ABC transporter permease n=1 Tax=Glaciihabitans sp. dw_435 TaxID=2720081 RepID=UPI001BD65E39|nr:ABC transporter permease [Glaciihabitans sp. dw_435]